MARASHKVHNLHAEKQLNQVLVTVDPAMRRFLDDEAKRLSEKSGRHIYVTELVRALITAYYEKRVAGLLVSPND